MSVNATTPSRRAALARVSLIAGNIGRGVIRAVGTAAYVLSTYIVAGLVVGAAEYIVTGDITSFTTGAASAFAVVVAITGWGGRS
jgi:hypothetical protein